MPTFTACDVRDLYEAAERAESGVDRLLEEKRRLEAEVAEVRNKLASMTAGSRVFELAGQRLTEDKRRLVEALRALHEAAKAHGLCHFDDCAEPGCVPRQTRALLEELGR